jgi:pimeloyl-ACP methyl ester carboxylesterase
MEPAVPPDAWRLRESSSGIFRGNSALQDRQADLVIASAESPLLDAQKKMSEAIKGAEFVTVENTGHAFFVDDPRAFDEALQHLLTSIGTKP